MLNTLRNKLTLLSALLTGIIVLVVCVFSFQFAKYQYVQSQVNAFRVAISDILTEWTQNKSIDFNWLHTQESEHNMILYLEENAEPLQFSLTNEKKISLAQKAKDYALTEYGIDTENTLFFNRDNIMVTFIMTDENVQYRCKVQVFPTANGTYAITALQDLKTEEDYIFRMGILFLSVLIVALLLNIAACWIVAGRAIQSAEKYAKEQEEFVLTAGHELRTPLAVLEAGFTAIEIAPNKSQEYLPIMRLKTTQMGQLVNDLMLLFSKNDLKLKIIKVAVEIDTFLIEYIEMSVATAKAHNVTLNFHIQDKLFTPVFADKGRLQQILDILLDNAYRYAPFDSEIIFSVEQFDKNTVLKISDFGKGISDDDKKSVFDKFYRADGKDSSGAHFGLGLSVVKEIILLHKGTISITDNFPSGATFTIVLPNM